MKEPTLEKQEWFRIGYAKTVIVDRGTSAQDHCNQNAMDFYSTPAGERDVRRPWRDRRVTRVKNQNHVEANTGELTENGSSPMNGNRMKGSRSVALPPVVSILLAVLSVQGGATVAKGLFPVIGAAGAAAVRIGLSALILAQEQR